MSLKFLAVALCASVLAGCVTTRHSSMEPAATAGEQPRESAQDQRTDAARVHTELGQRYMQRGQLEMALDKLKTALEFDPDYVPANTVIAVLYERIGKLQLAEKYYRIAQKIEPDKGPANNNLGQFLCKIGRIDESIKYFNQAVADPFYKTPTAALLNEGTCLLKANRPSQATEPLRHALALRPDSPEALYLMASALTEQKDYFHARAFIQRFEASGRPSADALLLAYRIETGLGDADVAQQYAKRLRNEFPDSEQTRSLSSRVNP
ncbi:MAG TPA: type IV pilus biogenesis/stability protein PilW [Rhodanobacteraceae bacterium]|nr:type IV pilus biogenesis/stability protein PilW [Rhodanobacteraceae bacterium]